MYKERYFILKRLLLLPRFVISNIEQKFNKTRNVSSLVLTIYERSLLTFVNKKSAIK